MARTRPEVHARHRVLRRPRHPRAGPSAGRLVAGDDPRGRRRILGLGVRLLGASRAGEPPPRGDSPSRRRRQAANRNPPIPVASTDPRSVRSSGPLPPEFPAGVVPATVVGLGDGAGDGDAEGAGVSDGGAVGPEAGGCGAPDEAGAPPALVPPPPPPPGRHAKSPPP